MTQFEKFWRETSFRKYLFYIALAVTISMTAMAQKASAQVTISAFTNAWDEPVIGATQALYTTDILPAGTGNDGKAYDLGTMFQANVPGIITKIHYFKPGTDNTAQRYARIWSFGDKRKIFEVLLPAPSTSSGWQEYALPTPLRISANTPYIITVNVDGDYPFRASGLVQPLNRVNLVSTDSPFNGVFTDNPGQFPDDSYANNDYLRGVTFRPDTTVPAPANAIVKENRRRGHTDWKITNAAQANEILAYSDRSSINKGQILPIRASIQAASGTMSVDVYRIGYYNGFGARKIASRANIPVTNQSATPTTENAATGLKEYNWTTTVNIQTSAQWISGFYLAKLTHTATGEQTQVWFTVRDDAGTADIIANIPVTTYQAYNVFGGKSLYSYQSPTGRAYEVSFSRPYHEANNLGVSPEKPRNYEYPMIRWLERMGYSVTYTTNLDLSRTPNPLLDTAGQPRYKMFLSIGHDEYWTQPQFNNVRGARDAGMDLVFLSANTAYWRIRLTTINGKNRMICYKSEESPFPVDPGTPVTKRFRDPAVNSPEDRLLGVSYIGDHGDIYGGFPLIVDNPSHPYFLHTGFVKGSVIPGLVGYEWDGDRVGATPPANRVVLFRSPVFAPGALPPDSNGERNQISLGTVYTAASGAKVFAAGTIQAMWGLDSMQDRDLLLNGVPRENLGFKQFVYNVFRDMGVRPATPVDIRVH